MSYENLNIRLKQLNPTIRDLVGNRALILSGTINDRTHATLDRYYNDDPFLVGDKVHFLSKRRKGNSSGGLTAPDNVYISE